MVDRPRSGQRTLRSTFAVFTTVSRHKPQNLLHRMSILLSLLASATCFSSHAPAAMQQRGSALFMKAPSDPLSNLARKFKRKLRSADATSFAELYSTEFEDFLKSKASSGIYNSIYPKLVKRARQLNVAMKPGFGERPKAEHPDIAATAAALGTVESFLRAVTAAGLTDALTGSLCTLFAPSDEAFAKLEPGRWDAIVQDSEQLQAVVRHHIVDGSLSSKRIAERNGQALTSLHGADLPVKVGKVDKALTVSGAKMLQTDIKCKNGIMHVIDSLLIPSA